MKKTRPAEVFTANDSPLPPPPRGLPIHNRSDYVLLPSHLGLSLFFPLSGYALRVSPWSFDFDRRFLSDSADF